jgi:alkyl hydroperoxide reductase subunit AhpC
LKAFTPVCTTEMIAFAKANPYFERLNTCLLGLSVDSNPSHLAWIYDIYCRTGIVIPFPIIADRNGEIARKYGMISSTVNNTATVRNVFIIDDKQIVRTILVYPMNIGRNIPEILRVVRALQVSDCNNQMAPVNWMPNEPMIVPMPQTFAQLQERNENIMKQQNGMNWYLSFKNPEKLCINEKCMQKEENRIIDEPKKVEKTRKEIR